jgi:hypothetical protein
LDFDSLAWLDVAGVRSHTVMLRSGGFDLEDNGVLIRVCQAENLAYFMIEGTLEAQLGGLDLDSHGARGQSERGEGNKDDKSTDDCTRLGFDWAIKVWEGYQV